MTIQAYDAENTCINGQTFEVKVAGNVINSAKCSNDYTAYYTGEAITPTQTDLGDLTITGKEIGKDDKPVTEKLQKDQWTITGYKANVNAGTGYVTVKILGDSTYANQTVDVPFTINPLEVSEATVTVPETITYNKGYDAASDYKVPLVVTATDPSGKIVKGLSAADYTVSYEYIEKVANRETDNVKHNKIKATITLLNKNFVSYDTKEPTVVVMNNKLTEIVAKALNDNMIKLTPDTYTYTGGNIIPEYYVTDGAFVLNEGKVANKNASEE